MIGGLLKMVIKFFISIVRLLFISIPLCAIKTTIKTPIFFLRFLHPVNLTICMVKTTIKTALLLAVLGVAAYNYEIIARVVCPNKDKAIVFPFEAREWGRVPTGKTEVMPFKVSVPDNVLDDLKRRLENTRYGSQIEGVNFEYGFPPNQLQNVVNHWQRSFNWKKQEALLNNYPQFKTEIEGLNIHFVHAKPQVDAKTKVLPIILLHGFPGSFFELYKLIPLLTTARSFKTNSTTDPTVSVAFEVIIPSLPGYGFSDAAKVPGMETGDMARIMHKLMTRLGHTGYVVHGGDWGSIVGKAMAVMYPRNVKGLELTMYPIPIGAAAAKGTLALALSKLTDLIPKSLLLKNLTNCIIDPAETDKIMWNNVGTLLSLSGYFHFQASRPDTVGAGVTDSPAGLAAYILDMFSWATNSENVKKANGGLDTFTMDELLTNVMIYWVSGSVMTAQRLYKEAFTTMYAHDRDAYIVTVPTVLSDFPNEIRGGNPPLAFAKPYYKNLVAFRRHDKPCGHFAAMECPKDAADDIWTLVPHFVSKPLTKEKPVKKEL